jgi:hypothetical protein
MERNWIPRQFNEKCLNQYVKESLISDDKLEKVNDVLDRLNEIENTIIRVVKAENFKMVAKDDK